MQLLINCPAEGHRMEELWSTLGPGTEERKNLWSSHLFGLTLLFQHVQTLPSPLWIGRTWTNVCGSPGSLMFLQGGSALWFCPLIANAINLQFELNLNLNPTWFVRLMKIIVAAVKIAAKYNCDRCGNRRPMINDESVMEKTKKTKKFPISEILEEKKTREMTSRYPGNN